MNNKLISLIICFYRYFLHYKIIKRILSNDIYILILVNFNLFTLCKICEISGGVQILKKFKSKQTDFRVMIIYLHEMK